MNKPEIPSSFSGPPEVGGRSASPGAFVQQPAPTQAAAHPTAHAARSVEQSGQLAYVDPYLFEIGYYASRAEYEELSRTATIRLRADVENARPKRKSRPKA